MIQDDGFVSEIGWAGHGLQMWLQVMWFLARAEKSTTLVLDEPDVYMHPDLQRKLVRLVRRRTQQTILTTHSTEILAEAAPDDVLIVDRSRKKARFATNLPAVQRIVEHIGGVHNLQLSRLWSAKKCLLVEGKDIQLLKIFQDVVFPDSACPVDTIPNMPIGGWDGWGYAVGSSMIMMNSVDHGIRVVCVFDRDYRDEETIAERAKEARDKGISLHVWAVKEIENHLARASAIVRYVNARCRADRQTNTAEVEEAIDAACEALRPDVIRGLADEYQRRHRKEGQVAGLAANEALRVVEAAWQQRESRIAIAPGKALMGHLSRWAKEKCGVSFGPHAIARELLPVEVPAEIRELLAQLER
jgi:hypothetical protein